MFWAMRTHNDAYLETLPPEERKREEEETSRFVAIRDELLASLRKVEPMDRIGVLVSACLAFVREIESAADRKKKEAFLELKKEGHTQIEIAEITGESEPTVSRHLSNERKQRKNSNEINGDGSEDISNETLLPLDAVPAAQKTRAENEKQRKTELEKPAEVILLPGLYSGDFRDISRQIADDSVQLIFTDPPYDKDSVQLYEDAAKAARRILKPGGSFIAYSGQRHLPAVRAKATAGRRGKARSSKSALARK